MSDHENDPDLEREWERRQIVITALYIIAILAVLGVIGLWAWALLGC